MREVETKGMTREGMVKKRRAGWIIHKIGKKKKDGRE